jgi:hypothetical protein
VLCAAYDYDHEVAHPMMSQLPPVMPRAATAARSARAHDDRGHRYAPGIVIDGIELRDRVWLDREVT